MLLPLFFRLSHQGVAVAIRLATGPDDSVVVHDCVCLIEVRPVQRNHPVRKSDRFQSD